LRYSLYHDETKTEYMPPQNFLGQARFVWPLFWIIRWVRNRTDNEISEDKKTQMQHNIQGFNIIFTVSTYSAVSFVFIYPTVNFLPCSF